MRITVESLSKRYGGVRALDGVSFTIEPGQILAVLGVNGAGKTTLLRCFSSVVAGCGSISYDGERFTRGSMNLRRKIAFLPDFQLPFRTTLFCVILGSSCDYMKQRFGCRTTCLELKRGFDILPLIDTPMFKLSRGQAPKAALAALLAVNAELLLLDEPFASGMDPNGVTFLKREARAAAAGATVLYSTQILDIAETLSDRLLKFSVARLATTLLWVSFRATRVMMGAAYLSNYFNNCGVPHSETKRALSSVESERKHAENCGNRILSKEYRQHRTRWWRRNRKFRAALGSVYILAVLFLVAVRSGRALALLCVVALYASGTALFRCANYYGAHFAATTALCSSPYLFWMMIICDTSHAVSSDRG